MKPLAQMAAVSLVVSFLVSVAMRPASDDDLILAVGRHSLILGKQADKNAKDIINLQNTMNDIIVDLNRLEALQEHK